MKNLLKAYAATLAFAAVTLPVHAELVARDLSVGGDGLLTLDTETNLQWLDVTQTLNMSFDAVSLSLAANGSLAGYRYATGTEVAALFLHAGVTVNDGFFGNYGEANNVLALVGLLGRTGFPSGGYPGPATRGIYGDAYGQDSHLLAGSGIRDVDLYTYGFVGGGGISGYAYLLDDATNTSVGSFLVRVSAVPEPSSMSLALLGLSVLLFRRPRVQPRRSKT